MRASNVAGTVDIIRLALSKQSSLIPIHHVSTMSILTPNILDSEIPDPLIEESAYLCTDPEKLIQLDGYRYNFC